MKLKDRRTSIKCDIQNSSKMGVRNSGGRENVGFSVFIIGFFFAEFLKCCNDAEERFLPLVCIVKYICIEHGILGSGLGSHINSYTLVLLVLFFLQNKKLIPSVQHLQQDIEEEFIDSWNFAFCRKKIEAKLNQSEKFSVSELLYQFFDFYATFDYGSLMISPLAGFPLKKYNVKHGLDLPSCLARNTNFCRTRCQLNTKTELVLQDPFEVSHFNACNYQSGS